jgi:hypothetical protein
VSHTIGVCASMSEWLSGEEAERVASACASGGLKAAVSAMAGVHRVADSDRRLLSMSLSGAAYDGGVTVATDAPMDAAVVAASRWISAAVSAAAERVAAAARRQPIATDSAAVVAAADLMRTACERRSLCFGVCV